MRRDILFAVKILNTNKMLCVPQRLVNIYFKLCLLFQIVPIISNCAYCFRVSVRKGLLRRLSSNLYVFFSSRKQL